jgi:S1-C subfamily serine protease
LTGILGHRFSAGSISRTQPLEVGNNTSARKPATEPVSCFHSGSDAVKLNYQFDPIQVKALHGEQSCAIPGMRITDSNLHQVLSIVDEANPMARLYARIQPSVLKIGWKDHLNGGTGTAFVLEDGWLATAHHVIKPAANGSPRNYYAIIDGVEHPLYPVWKDVSADLALLRLQNPQTVLPPGLRLGWASDLKANQNVSALGFPADANKLVLTEGPVIDVYAKIDCPSVDPLTVAINMQTARIQSRAATWTGNSGGPLVTSDGTVIGIVTSGIPAQAESFSTSVEHLRLLLDRARNTSFGSGPVNELHSIGRVLGKPGATEFKVKVDGLKPNWLQDSVADSVSNGW